MRQEAKSDFILGNVGDMIEGYYVAHETEEKNSRDGGGVYLEHRYYIQNERGAETCIIGKTSINQRFLTKDGQEKIPVGCYVWIERKDDVPTNRGNVMQIYKIEFDDEKKIGVKPRAAAPAPEPIAPATPEDLPF